MSEPVDIATRYLNAQCELSSAEFALEQALLAAGFDWDEQFCDPYDGSLEAFGPDLTPEEAERMAGVVIDLGFERVWIHRHEGTRDKCRGPDGTGNGRCTKEHYKHRPK